MMKGIDLNAGGGVGMNRKKKELVFEGGMEYIMHAFEDSDNTQMLSIEFHHPSGAKREEYELNLSTNKRGRRMVLGIKHNMNRIFLAIRRSSKIRTGMMLMSFIVRRHGRSTSSF